MQKLRRLKDLILLFFSYVRTKGIAHTFKKTAGYFKARSVNKKGRFLPKPEELARQRAEDLQGPKISVCTALFNTDKRFLQQYLQSVLGQTYKNFELCLADASDDAHAYVGQLVQAFDDERIKYIKLDENGGISRNTNAAAALAGGQYIALADHDDILAPNALYEIAKAALETGAQFIYSDEALFTKDYLLPRVGHFKPDFAPDYLNGCNYICHLSAFDRQLFTELGGLDPAFDGSQDHDLFLKLSEQVPYVHHIKKVLYYWRVHAGSTSGGVGAKPYVEQAAISALNAHFARTHQKAQAHKGLFASTYRIEYELSETPLVSIIIPSKDHVEDLDRLLKSLYEKTTYKNFEVIVVENNSELQHTFDYYNKVEGAYKNLKVVRYTEKGFNFSRINNFGRSFAKGAQLLLLNNDIEVITPDWLEQMLMYSQRADVGCVGPMLYYGDDTIQHAGVVIGLGGYAAHSFRTKARGSSGYMFRAATVQNVSAVTAACLMVKAAIFDEMNGLDENFTVAYNDVDFNLRVRDAGYKNIFTPFAELYHLESVSRGVDKNGEKQQRFNKEKELLEQKHGKLRNTDPFYSPSLTHDAEDFAESSVLPEY